MTVRERRDAPTASVMVRSPHQILALFFGVGLVRHWPGTLGTLAGFLLYEALRPTPLGGRIALYLAFIVVGAWACHRTGRDLGDPDHNAMVVDETVAMSLVLEFLPRDVAYWIAGFLLFRIFDVAKPWPANVVDRRFHGGFFVMLDDLLAAAYAVLVLHLTIWILIQ